MVVKNLKDKIVRLRLPHYLVGGAVTFIAEYTSFLLLFYTFGLGAVSSNTISFCLALSVSFVMNRQWVFKHTDMNSKKWHNQLVMYFCLAILNLIVTNLSIHALVGWSVPAYIAKLLLIGLVASWNFVIYKRLIFVYNDE